MTAQDLIGTARALVADDKGLLAMDESTPTCNRRFAALGIPQTEEVRRVYRELIVTTAGLSESVSGVILYDETIRQRKKDGTPFVKAIANAGIITGIKVDTGAKDMAGHRGEKITEGLDGLRERLEEYSGRWRFRSPAPFSNRRWRSGAARRLTCRRRSKLSITEPPAIAPLGVANTLSRRKAREHRAK